ncbi:hypothetical protein LI89_15640 [Yersinia enterocolitica]|nr:hypothetical protein FORC2_1164 [Yersinia enterocolitica]ALG46094.1 hypothetical protein LI89_15640 [Yersinia enterocolitica]
MRFYVMRAYKADFIIVRGIVDSFLKDETIRSKLAYISDKKTNDWEKWLQIELEYFMKNKHQLIVLRETAAIPDKRILKNRYKMYVDIIFRKKRTRINSYIFLELKCTKRVSALLKGIEMDINKVNSIRTTEYDQRSFWCIGFHHACDTKSIDKINNFRIKYDFFHHEIIELCNCGDVHLANCKKKQIGLLIV